MAFLYQTPRKSPVGPYGPRDGKVGYFRITSGGGPQTGHITRDDSADRQEDLRSVVLSLHWVSTARDFTYRTGRRGVNVKIGVNDPGRSGGSTTATGGQAQHAR